MRLDFNAGRWVVIKGDNIEIEVCMRPLTFLEKVRAMEMFGAEEHVAETIVERDDRGAPREKRLTRIVPRPNRASEATAFMLGKVVLAWRNVENEHGEPVPFSPQALDAVMGRYPQWGAALAEKARQMSGIDAPEGGEADPQTTTGN